MENVNFWMDFIDSRDNIVNGITTHSFSTIEIAYIGKVAANYEISPVVDELKEKFQACML